VNTDQKPPVCQRYRYITSNPKLAVLQFDIGIPRQMVESAPSRNARHRACLFVHSVIEIVPEVPGDLRAI
jgi:hypothetical protein